MAPRTTEPAYSRQASNSMFFWESPARVALVATYRLLHQTPPGDELDSAERGQVEHGSGLQAMMPTPESLSVAGQRSGHVYDERNPLHHLQNDDDHDSLARNHGSIAPGNNDEQYTTNDEVGVGHPASFHSQDILGLGAALEVVQEEKIPESIEETDLGSEDKLIQDPIDDDDDP